jgi:hypothetical protein
MSKPKSLDQIGQQEVESWLNHPVTKAWFAAVRSKADGIGNTLLDNVFGNDGLEKEVIENVRMKALRFGLLDAIDIKGEID